MSLFNVMDIAGTAMSAQSVRLNTTASNLANADSVSSSAGAAYKARHPVFASILENAMDPLSDGASAGVAIEGIVESDAAAIAEYNPNHPLADKDGYIYRPNVNPVEELADMMSASRSYQTNVQLADTAKSLYTQTLRLGSGR